MEDMGSRKNATIIDLFDDEDESEEDFSETFEKASNKSNIPKKEKKDKYNKDISKKERKIKDNKSKIPITENRDKKEKSKIPITENRDKKDKSNSNNQNKNKFNSSKDEISSKFEENSNIGSPVDENNSSDKTNVFDGEFKVKEKINDSNNMKNPSRNNKNNENNRAKSIMNRLRNIGGGVVINLQNNDSEDTKEANKVPKDEIKRKSDEFSEKIEIVSDNDFEEEIEIVSDNDFEEEIEISYSNDDESIDNNQNLYEEEGINIIDDELEDNEEYSPDEDLEDNDEYSPDEDLKVNDEYSLDEELEDISEDIIREISEEDLENNESEGMENMNEYRTPRRKKEEIIDDSPDVIVPISAEIRKNNQNNPYDEDADYISPINEEEYEEFYEEDEFEELFKETEHDSAPNDYSETNAEHMPDSDNPDSPYYYSAVGIENALKKNAVQYPKNNDRNKTGLAGTVNSLKNEMLYLKASMDEIENPTEREMVYVIDRNADDEFFEDPYDPYQETVFVENTQNVEDDAYESLFTSKKHEYLDKIEEYTNQSSNDEYLDDSISDTFLDELSHSGYVEESEPIIPIDSEANVSDEEFVHIEDIDLESDLENRFEDIGLNSELDDDQFEDIELEDSFEDIELDDDQFEDIITDVGHDYQELEDERIREANVLSAVDNTRLTPSGKLSDYIEDYKEIDDIIIKSPAEIYEDEMKLATAIMDIVAAEGPVHVDTVVRRLRESCGLSRAGTKFKNTILETIDRNESHLLLIREKDFLFIDYDSIKVRKRVKPNIDLISEVEIEKAIDLVLSFEKSLKVQELAKNVSRAFGFRSTSKKTSAKITLVIDAMIGKGVLINNNGKIEFR